MDPQAASDESSRLALPYRAKLVGVGLALLAALGALAPLARAWIAGLTVLHRDQLGTTQPIRWLAGEAIRHGRLPLWNPFCATGMPYLAETTHGALHPLSIATALLFPSDALDPLMGAWIAAAGAGAFVLARTLGASPVASLVAGFGYGLAGFTLSMTSNMVGLTGVGSAPWIVAGLRFAGVHRSPAGYLAGAAGVAAGALAGDTQGLAASTLLGLALAAEGGGLRGIAFAGIATLNGALVGALQLAPTWSYLQHSDRFLPLSFEERTQWDFAPWRLIELISPGFFAQPSDGLGPSPVFVALGHPTLHDVPFTESVFVGGALLLLAISGTRRSRPSALLAAGAGIALWAAFGHHLGARAVQDLLPVVSSWRYGERYLGAFVLLTSVLAAHGADRLAGDEGRARRWAWAALASAGICLALVAMAPLLAAAALGPGPGRDVVSGHLRSGLPHGAIALAGLAMALFLFPRMPKAARLPALAGLVLLSGLAASAYALRPGSREARLSTAPPALRADPPGPRVLTRLHGQGAVPRTDWDSIDKRAWRLSSAYGPNFNARERVDNLLADSTLLPLRHWLVTEGLQGLPERAFLRFGVTHVAIDSAQPLDPGRFGAGAILEKTDPRTGTAFWAVAHRPWAVFPSEVVAVRDLPEALDTLRALEAAGRRTAIVETGEPGIAPTTTGRILSSTRGLSALEVVAEADREGVLVVNDGFDEGWRAFIDGAEVRVLPADVMVRAVVFPPGRHTLTMKYDPTSARVGVWLALLGLAAASATAALLFRLRK